MPGPDPHAVWQDDDAEPGQIAVSFDRPWNGNLTARKARAIAILRNLQKGGWRCRCCGDPVGIHKRADAKYCAEGCRKRAKRARDKSRT